MNAIRAAMGHPPPPFQAIHNSAGATIIDLPAALDRIGGDYGLFRELSLIFVEDSPKLLEELRDSLTKQDRPQAERRAHALKGIAANVGGMRVERLAVVVEDAARSGQLSLAEIGLETLSGELMGLIEALRRLLSEPSPHSIDPPSRGGF